jgi:hypothetical protein
MSEDIIEREYPVGTEVMMENEKEGVVIPYNREIFKKDPSYRIEGKTDDELKKNML